jgi:hypothetical protein
MIEVLYKKKIIRDFLSLFTENYWKQLIGYMLEYGIITFKKHHNIASMSPEDITQIIDKMKRDENLEEKKMTNLLVSRSISKDKNVLVKSQSRTQIGSKIAPKTPQRSITPQRDNKLSNKLRLKTNSDDDSKNKTKKPILTKLNESDNESRIKSNRAKKESNNKIVTTSKPKQKFGLLEQANLNKLKEKRNKSLIRSKTNTDDESKKPKLYNNVESRIKSAVEKDKKTFHKGHSLIETSSTAHLSKPIQKAPVDENKTIKNSTFTNYNLPKSSTTTNIPNYNYNTGIQYDRFIGDARTSFEDKLNGLKQKISAFEENNM